MANINEKNKRLKEIHQREEALYAERNERYGDSFSETFKKYGPTSVLIRLGDKLSRIDNLITNGLSGSDGESLVDTLMDLSNYANMAIMELMEATQKDIPTQEPPKKKRKKSKAHESEEKENTTLEKGPLDSLTKKELAQVVNQLGGTVPKKPNRETLMGIINDYPKARVAVAITSLKSEATEASSEEDNGEEE